MKDESLPADDARFDRLVDGELSAEEYRTLVGGLDQEPGGWRSCAMAFLESQALANELGGMRKALDVRPAGGKPKPTTAGPLWRGTSTLLAMAASFALALGLGIALPRIWPAGSQDEPLGGNLLAAPQFAGDGGIRHEAFRPIGNVRLVVNGAGGEQADAEVPVYEIGQNLEEYLQQSQPALDPLLVEWLEQQGHDVVVEQHFIPGQIDDGRPMYVPVDQYRITPVKRSY